MVESDRIASILVTESFRRAVKRAAADFDKGVVEVDVNAYGYIDPEELRQLAALNIAMTRLIEAARMN